jgi:cytokinin dehydrogenase
MALGHLHHDNFAASAIVAVGHPGPGGQRHMSSSQRFPIRRRVKNTSRRRVVKGLAGFGLGVAIGVSDIRNVAPAHAQDCYDDDTPQLDGDYLVDEAARRALSVDYGRSFLRLPLAVAKPRSISDIVRIVQHANKVGLKVAMRGQGHSLSGQTLIDAGIVIDSSTLNAVGPASDHAIDAQAGALWRDVVGATLAQGFLPPVTPDALMLSVGGTLSVGGIGETSYRFGAQVDHVRELDVVTGTGEFMTCSEHHNPELFAMMLAGLGQCGIIVRARLALNLTERFVMTYTFSYPDIETLLSDQARFTQSEALGPLNGRLVQTADGIWRCLLMASRYVADGADAARTPNWIKELRPIGVAEPVLATAWNYLDRRTASIMARKAEAKPNPSLVLSLPAAATGPFIAEVLGSQELSAGVWFFEVSPKIPARHKRPLQKMPSAALAYELRLQRQASAFGATDHREMLIANQRLATLAMERGGKVYPPFAPILSRDQWQTHFGSDVWARFVASKQRYDPNNVLNLGAGIF